ncbi:MAG: M42 family metallopeptidase, partial [Blastochloris sp.]|nr:M42 family metallopeptidase [Blastochloris sp.]
MTQTKRRTTSGTRRNTETNAPASSDLTGLIKRLVEAWGPSGYEHHVRDLIRAEAELLADEVRVDPLGNLICRVGSGGPKVMVAAHMDEIGVMA